MPRPTRNVVALVALDLTGITPGEVETMGDAVARFLLERIGPDADEGEGVALSSIVYVDADEFLDDFAKGDIPHPGVYEGDDWSVNGRIEPERVIR